MKQDPSQILTRKLGINLKNVNSALNDRRTKAITRSTILIINLMPTIHQESFVEMITSKKKWIYLVNYTQKCGKKQQDNFFNSKEVSQQKGRI